MRVEQFVMAYRVNQDRLRAMLPQGFTSLRPVLRMNAEVRDDEMGYVELNTAAEKCGVRGWINIAHWENVPFICDGKTVEFKTPFLTLSFTGVGIEGSCPAESDNNGCFFVVEGSEHIRTTEIITSNREFCDCEFAWSFTPTDAHGVSVGKIIPAYMTEVQNVYEKQALTPQNAAAIPCELVLGSYKTIFER